MDIAMILPASEIPDRSEVCKATGSKRYLLVREPLRIFVAKELAEDGKRGAERVNPPEGGVFLTPRDAHDGSIDTVAGTTYLKWNLTEEEALEFLEEREQERRYK